MISAFLIFWPLLLAFIILVLKPAQAKVIAVFAALVELGVTGYISLQRGQGIDLPTEINWPWINYFNTHFHIGMDGISLILVLLTTLLTPLIIGSTVSSGKEEKPAGFYSLILFMEMALIGVFTAKDAFLFYIFWELALIPIYFICLRWGGENRGKITLKFFIYTLAGSLIMLLAFIYIYYHTAAPHSFDMETMYAAARALPANAQELVFIALFFAFAIKMPVFPFHTWQPDTYHTAPAQGTMLLSGIMLKMGTYGLIRWLLPLAPLGIQKWGTPALILSIIGIIYGSCIAFTQKDLKKLLAYSSIAHVGLIAAGILTVSKLGIQGALIQMVSHGIIVVALFYIVEIILQRTGSQNMDQLGGIRGQAPAFTSVFILILLGNIALPLTSGFIGEFLLITSIFQWNAVWGFIAGLGIILGAAYMLRSFQKTMLGERNNQSKGFADLNAQERIILFALAFLVLVLGIFPSSLMNLSEEAVDNLLLFISSNSN